MSEQKIAFWVMTVSALIVAITIHEWAHAIVADKLGDDTPRKQGRVTLWPPAHLDPVGTILMMVSAAVGFGIGWGKPVITQPGNYKGNPRLGSILVSGAGPLSNLVLASGFGLILRLGLLPAADAFNVWLIVFVSVNLSLFLFNLLPLYPLDGSQILLALLPLRISEKIRPLAMQVSLAVFLLLMFTGTFSLILRPLHGTLFPLLTGLR